jgi:hypothetical protein
VQIVTERKEPADRQNDQDALEEPYIEGAEPKTTEDYVLDSQLDSATVDDGILATDPEEPESRGEGWTFNG